MDRAAVQDWLDRYVAAWQSYDRAAIGEFPGAQTLIGHRQLADFWLGLRSSFPSAVFTRRSAPSELTSVTMS